jgi:hypothetical protein
MPNKGNQLAVDLVVNDSAALRRVQKFRDALKETNATVNDLGKNSSFAGQVDAQLARAEKRHKDFVSKIKKQSSEANGAIGEAGDALKDALGFGNAAGQLIGGAIGTGIAIWAKQSVDALKASQDAQRVLTATAKETGTTYDALAEKAKKFGDQTLQSNIDAQRTFAQIANFANAAGRNNKLDEFRQKLTDLAAAKGIDPSNLGEIAKQLNALTDEATDKLLNANPSAFYDKFAASIGKTADQLSDAEKRAAVFDEVIKRGAIFSGEAEKRVNSTAGAFDRLKKAIADAQEGTGKFLQAPIDLAFATGSLLSGPADRGRANAAIQNGIGKAGTIAQIITIPIRFALDVTDNVTQKIGNLLFGVDAARAAGDAAAQSAERVRAQVVALASSDKDIAAAKANPFGSVRDLALSQLDPSKTFFSQADRDKAIADAVTNAEKFKTDLNDRLKNSLKGGGDQRFAFAEFLKFKNLFSKEDQETFVRDFSKTTADAYAAAIQAAGPNAAKLREILKDATGNQSLQGGDADRIRNAAIEAINRSVKEATDKVVDLQKKTRELFGELAASDNPFVKVFSDADKQLEKVRLTTAALSADMKKVFEDMAAGNAADALFSARLDSGLKAEQFRDTARRFREGGEKPYIDPEILKKPGGLDRFARQKFGDLAQFAYSGGTGLFGQNGQVSTGMFDSLRSAIARDAVRAQAGGDLDTQSRLDRQLTAIRNAGTPANDRQAAEADRRILALAENVDPAKLTQSQKSQVAAAAERMAIRTENSESDARKQRADANKIAGDMQKDINELLKIAKKDGLTGVIRIINEAEDKAKVSLGLRPNDSDTAATMDQ